MSRATRNAALILNLIQFAASDLHSHIGFNFETGAAGSVRIEMNGSLHRQTEPPLVVGDAPTPWGP
jgi:hypothetical protein